MNHRSMVKYPLYSDLCYGQLRGDKGQFVVTNYLLMYCTMYVSFVDGKLIKFGAVGGVLLGKKKEENDAHLCFFYNSNHHLKRYVDTARTK